MVDRFDHLKIKMIYSSAKEKSNLLYSEEELKKQEQSLLKRFLEFTLESLVNIKNKILEN